MPNTNQNLYGKVTITHGTNDNKTFGERFLGTLSYYWKALQNTYTLITQYNASNDPNAFHRLLIDEYAKIPDGKLKVLNIPLAAPNKTLSERVIGIGNPVIIKALRQVPRIETVSDSFYENHPEAVKISGGIPFGTALEAIGMGILSAKEEVHFPFTQQMIATLTISSIKNSNAKSGTYQAHFIDVVKEETDIMLASISANQPTSLDFRFYALKIFLRGFYPNATWEDDWIRALSDVIEDVSDAAFKYITNPYTGLEALRVKAKTQLDPFIERLMQEDQSFYLSKEYCENEINTQEIQRQIIVSLLFAGGDNIKKFTDHVLVEFGKTNIRENNLKEPVSEAQLKLMIKEVGRLFTTIYAQPGTALEDFTIHYQNDNAHIDEKIEVHTGDLLHLTTFHANKDPLEWGPFADTFNVEENAKHYAELNPLSTFGSGSRICRGKTVTLTIIEYMVSELMKKFTWEARVDGKPDFHPNEFGFNNGIPGEITYLFRERNELKAEIKINHSPLLYGNSSSQPKTPAIEPMIQQRMANRN